MSCVCDVKENITDLEMLGLLVLSIYNPTEERLLKRARQYQDDENTHIYAYNENDKYKGIIVFEIVNSSATILDIAVKPECQRNGIGSKLIDFIFNQFEIDKVIAETDDDAVEFYKKCGFTVAPANEVSGIKRYICEFSSVSRHYNLLIEDNNDPVNDPETLKEYMDKWDGQQFIDSLKLSKQKSVLEIGVGTGRLAVRVSPLCGEFFGIDISPKTIERAKENLKEYKNTTLICEDFNEHEFYRKFDVIYSSLTFMHIEEKQKAINKVAALLKDSGRFVLSIDKNQERFIDTGTRKITVFPDTGEEMKTYIANSGLLLLEHFETEFAYIFVAKKECKCYCGHDCSRYITYIATKTDDDNIQK